MLVEVQVEEEPIRILRQMEDVLVVDEESPIHRRMIRRMSFRLHLHPPGGGSGGCGGERDWPHPPPPDGWTGTGTGDSYPPSPWLISP